MERVSLVGNCAGMSRISVISVSGGSSVCAVLATLAVCHQDCVFTQQVAGCYSRYVFLVSASS